MPVTFPGTPPSSPEAERAVLGGLLLDPSLLDEYIGLLQVEHFHDKRHSLLFRAMLEVTCVEPKQELDILSLKNHMEVAGDLGAAGGVAYIATLDADLPDLSRFGTYVEILEDKLSRRRMLEAARNLVKGAMTADQPRTSVLGEVQDALDAAGQSTRRGGLVSILEIATKELDRLEEQEPGEITGIPSGFEVFDRYTGGLEGGRLIYVAGRPGHGKSCWGLQVATAVAKQGHPAALFSLEMSSGELFKRQLAQEARIDHDLIRRANLMDSQWRDVAYASQKLAGIPLWVDDTPYLGTREIAAACRAHKSRHGLSLAVVDYVQIMNHRRQPGMNTNDAVTDTSKRLKALSRELDITVIGLCQLGRGPEQRADHTPLLSDLRESGSLEQDADVVLFLLRPVVYDQTKPKDEARFIFAKVRSGPAGKIERVFFDAPRQRFSDDAPEWGSHQHAIGGSR